MEDNLIEIYKNRIEKLMNHNYYNLNSIDGIGYFGKTFDELKNFIALEDEIIEFRRLSTVSKKSAEYKSLERKLRINKILNSCVDHENNSISELIDKIIELEVTVNMVDFSKNEETVNKIETENILFFDTETTGLPKNWKASQSDLDNWPRLVQLAYILYSKEGKLIQQGDWIIKPTNFSIPYNASQIHRITDEIANNEGVSLLIVLQNFNSLIKQSNCLVAHNMAFDEKIVGAEFLRHNMENLIPQKKKICTMQKTTIFCAIEGQYGYKWPKLSELYNILFNCNFDEAHNAAVDIKATSECFWELRKRKLL